VPQVAVLRDLCAVTMRKTQVCEYADLWHPPPVPRAVPEIENVTVLHTINA